MFCTVKSTFPVACNRSTAAATNRLLRASAWARALLSAVSDGFFVERSVDKLVLRQWPVGLLGRLVQIGVLHARDGLVPDLPVPDQRRGRRQLFLGLIQHRGELAQELRVGLVVVVEVGVDRADE